MDKLKSRILYVECPGTDEVKRRHLMKLRVYLSFFLLWITNAVQNATGSNEQFR